MIFLLAINVVAFTVALPALRAMSGRAPLHEATSAGVSAGAPFLNTVAGLCVMAPVFMEFLGVSRSMSGDGVPMGGTNVLPLFLIAVGSLVLLVFHLKRLVLRRRHPELNGRSLALSGLCVVAAGYLLFTIADHQAFFEEAEGAESGVLYLHAVKELDIKDVQCEAGWLLVKDIAGGDLGQVAFRCPYPTSFVIGRYSGQPFVAWPGYVEGESQELAAALKALFKNAVKPVS